MSSNISFSEAIESVSELTADNAKLISELYEEIYDKVSGQIDKLFLKEQMGEKLTATESLQYLRLQQLKAEIDKNLKEVQNQISNTIQNSMNTAAQSVVNGNLDWLKDLGLKFDTSMSSIPSNVIYNIVSGNLYGKGWTFSNAIWGDYNKTTGDLANVIAQGIMQNKSAYDIAQDLESYVNPSARKPWNWSQVYPGSKRQIDYNAQRLARTMVSHAYQQAIVATAKRNPFVTGIRWMSSGGERMCQICADRDGMIYKPENLPIDHPNGMCTYEAVIEKDMSEIADELADWVNGKENPALDEYAKSLGIDVTGFNYNALVSNVQEIIDKVTRADFDKYSYSESLENSLNEDAAKWWATLTRAQKDSIREYTSATYTEMNGYLRFGKFSNDDIIKKLVNDCQDALNKYSLNQTVVTRRGTTMTALSNLLGLNESTTTVSDIINNKDSFIDQVINDKGLMSTSIKEGFTKDVNFIILVPEGANAAYVANYSEYKDEKELLIQANSTFRIVDIEEKSGSILNVYLEMLV